MSDERDTPDRSSSPLMSLLFLVGGLAMIFIAWVWGRGSWLEAIFAGAIAVVGVTGVVAGAMILFRIRRNRLGTSK